MRLRTHLLLVGLLTGVVIEGAQAGEPPRGDCPPPPPGPATFSPHDGGPRGNFMIRITPLSDFDFDKDGRISRNEIDRGLKARFQDADENDDGTLDPEEFAASQPERPHGPPPGIAPPQGMPMPPPGAGCSCDCDDRRATPGHRVEWRHREPPDPKAAFNHLDWNLDGELSFEEFSAPIHQMALHLDRNGDGVIDADELNAPAMFFGPGFPPPGHPPPRDR